MKLMEKNKMKKPIIKDENYFTIFGWMINKLHLKGNELSVYAIIYGFTQDGETEFKGSREYIMSFTGIESKKTVSQVLNSLESKGYIEKILDNKVTGSTNRYKAVSLEIVFQRLEKEENRGVKITPLQDIADNQEENHNISGRVKITPPESKNYTPRDVKITPPLNNDDKNIIDKDNFIESKTQETNNKYINNKGEQNFELTKKQDGNYPRESYAELMDKHNLSEELKNTLWKFIQHCLMNNTFITNDKLERLILLLLENYSTDLERIGLILTAIDKGYVDVKRSKVIKHFSNEREYSDDYFKSLITKITKEQAV